jgi:hypothetical protein
MQTETSQSITNADIAAALTYQEYRDLIDRLMLVGRTTGESQTEAMKHFAKMNISRMKKWDKIFKVSEEAKTTMESIKTTQTWVILTEGWCGDAAQNIPVIMKLAEINSLIQVRFLLRDENLPIMDQFLTNGGRSIPKLIALDSNSLSPIFDWGPRPARAQELFLERKAKGLDYAEPLHAWYAKDKGMQVEQELIRLLANK